MFNAFSMIQVGYITRESVSTGMAIHRVSSSSRVWFEFELTFELAHARSILFAGSCMLGIELPKLQLPNWYHGKLPGKCQTGALG